jgi:superfamily I DNA/RNA helicase
VDLLGDEDSDIDAYLKGVSHVLVDEYQDVNRASARLVHGLSKYAEVWAVGDGHQAVYGFQGASARNLTDFDKDFPGAKHFALGDNHRSSQEIVDLYYAASTHSPSAVSAPHLHAINGPSGIKPECVTHAKEAELDTLAGLVASASRQGAVSTAVLVPTNDEAATLARGLEQRGVPVLYLGNVFERPDIKELLCLLHLSVDQWGASLAADWLSPEYNIPTPDLAKLAALAVDDRGEIVPWWDRDTATLSSVGKTALSRLDDLLRPVRSLVSPWDALCEILLEDGSSLRALCTRYQQVAVNARLAMYQFVHACRVPDTLAPYPTVRNLFDRIRRRIQLREHTGLRVLPPDAEGLNAVRVLTLHDCKGLEFDAIVLASARSKDRDKSDWPLIPTELLREATGLNDSEMRATQDHNLLYVGLSRPRRHLWIMREEGQRLPAELDTLEESSESLAQSTPSQTTDRIQEFDAISEATIDELVQYRECPRRVVLNRRIGRAPSGAFSIPRKLSLATRRIEIDLRERPELRTATAIQGLVERELRSLELWNHPAREQFAKRIGSFAANAAQGMPEGAIVPLKVSLQLGPIRIVVDVDRAVGDSASSYRIVRQRAARMEELRQPLGVLTRTHAEATGEKVTFHLHVLEDNSMPKPKKVQDPTISKYLANAEAMNAGTFPTTPSSRRCPRCRYFFQCHQGA